MKNGVWTNYGVACNVTTPVVTNIDENSFVRDPEADDNTDFSMNIYPNPVLNNELNLMFENTEYEGIIAIEIYNIMGVKMLNQEQEFSPGDVLALPIDGNYTNGVYFLGITIDNKKYFSKFVVAK